MPEGRIWGATAGVDIDRDGSSSGSRRRWGRKASSRRRSEGEVFNCERLEPRPNSEIRCLRQARQKFGDDALGKLKANPEIDMLFTDIVIPGGMSGWELADLAR